MRQRGGKGGGGAYIRCYTGVAHVLRQDIMPRHAVGLITSIVYRVYIGFTRIYTSKHQNFDLFTCLFTIYTDAPYDGSEVKVGPRIDYPSLFFVASTSESFHGPLCLSP